MSSPISARALAAARSSLPPPADLGRWLLALSIAVGVAAGVGVFTFRYAEGLSYFSTDPKACMNCHIMRPQYAAWLTSSHHTVAGCVDCHLPHAFIPKYLAKAENGYRHSKEFTAQTFPEPIAIRARGREILQQNCVECHDGLVHEIASGPRDADALDCVHCHLSVGHGERAGLGGPLHYPAETPQRANTTPSARATPDGT
jgi:cytochrome c nitrite reductase small subunit